MCTRACRQQLTRRLPVDGVAVLLHAGATSVLLQVLQQPDEKVAGRKTARQQALEQLAVKYCSNRGGGPRSSVQVEAEMMAHIASAEKKSNLPEGQLKHVRVMGHSCGAVRHCTQCSWWLYTLCKGDADIHMSCGEDARLLGSLCRVLGMAKGWHSWSQQCHPSAMPSTRH